MYYWLERSAAQIFGNAKPGIDSRKDMTVHAPRNAYSSVQFVIRDNEGPLTVLGARVIPDDQMILKYLKIRIFRQEYTLYDDGISYPDKLVELKRRSFKYKMPAHSAKVFRFDFFIAKDAPEGETDFTLRVETDKGDLDARLKLTIHKAVVTDPAESLFGHEYFFNPALLPREARLVRHSDEWWKTLEHYADVMKELRNNTVCVSLTDLLSRDGSYYRSKEDYGFRFDTFDKYVELFLAKGTARDFTLNAQIQSVEGNVIYALGPDTSGVQFPTLSEEGDDYLRALYGSVGRHLEEKGWDKIFRNHIEDEPHTTEVWLHTKRIIEEAAPCLKSGEPLDMIESATVIVDSCLWAVPRVNVYAEDPQVFQGFIEKGGELWLYSCCFPEEGFWLNKFVDLPHIRSRLMEWACVCVGAKGFLHWGFNYWGDGNSLYGFNKNARFKGDGAIVYPDIKGKKLALSARFMNTRDGLQDADLLMQILDKGGKTLKAKARKLLNETTHGDFIAHTDDPEEFEKLFEKLLKIADSLND